MIQVLMVGVSSKRSGGMWTVANSYMTNEEFCSQVKLRYVATSTGGNVAKRLLCMMFGFTKIFAILLTHKIDIVHVHMAEKGSVFRKLHVVRLARRFGCKTVVHMHAGAFVTWYGMLKPSVQDKIAKTLYACDRVLVLGEYWKSAVQSIIPLENVEVLYNGVVIPEKRPYRTANKNICYFGLLRKEKGTEELLQAIQMLDSTLDMDCKLYLYGLDWEGNIQQKIQQYGLTNRVAFAGWIEGKEKQEALENAMLSVLPSHYEALSMTVIEAMSYGIPVVTTDISTMGELLGENIPRIPVGDAEKLAEEIRRYYEDADLREETSQFLYERAKSHFNIERNVKQLLGIYDRILNKNDC